MNKNTLTAIITLSILGIVGFYYYKYTVMESTPGENQYRLANKYLEDGDYDEAIQILDELLMKHPEYKEAHLAKAITLLQMGMHDDSRKSFDRTPRRPDQ